MMLHKVYSHDPAPSQNNNQGFFSVVFVEEDDDKSDK